MPDIRELFKKQSRVNKGGKDKNVSPHFAVCIQIGSCMSNSVYDNV